MDQINVDLHSHIYSDLSKVNISKTFVSVDYVSVEISYTMYDMLNCKLPLQKFFIKYVFVEIK